MAVPHWPFVATVLLFLHPHGLPAHPAACLGQRAEAPVLNCSSSGLSLAPPHIQATVSELDLSHNLLNLISLSQPYPNLKNIWLGNNSITHLSLCVERTARGRADAHPRRSRSQRRQGCVSWAPSLQLLSVERNQLVQFPEGLGGSESLQVLQLAYNRISTLQPADLNALQQLRELHLQYNRITSLHPQALTPLSQLRVLDLSFNLLSTITPLTYLSLRTVRVGVELRGNRWRCDCSMQSVRRWMAYDTAQGRHVWRMVCTSPSALSGRDLLQLDEDHLTCSTADSSPGQHQHHHQDITVDEGSEILLPCGTTPHQVSTWWTPKSEVPLKKSQPGLLISNITETDTGLYVCVTESQQVSLSVFNLQIRKTEGKSRNPRSVPRGLIPQDIIHRVANETNKYPTQCDLDLAVSLSVIITFLVAFIIGVLVRPCIDILWRRMCNKKETSATYDVSSAEQRPYDNEAYSDGEEPVETEGHRERRVTFSTVDFREHSNVPYYDTVANLQENTSNDVVIGGGMTITKDKSEEAGSDSSSEQGSPEMKGRGSRDLQDDPHQGPAPRMEFEHIPDPSDQGERGSLSSHSDSSHNDKEQKEKLLMQKDPHAPQFPQQAEDAFQQRSESPTTRPVEVSQTSIEGTGFTCEPFAEWPPNMNDQNLRDPDLWNDSGEKFDFSDSIRSGSARSSSLFGSFNRSNQNVLSSSDKWKHADNSSSSSCMSGNEPTQYTINSEGAEEGHVEAIQLTHDTKVEIVNPYLKQDASLKEQGHEDPFIASLREELNQAECRPSVDPEHSDSSHSSDGGHTQHTVKQDRKEEEKMEWMVSEIAKQESRLPEAEQPGLGVDDPHPGKHLKTRAPLPPAAHLPSSSSESEAEMADRVEVRRDQMELEMTSREPDTGALDLQNIPKVKTHVDIKGRSPPPDSSSSENEDQITGHTVKQNVPQTKRKAPLPPNLSSSSESEEETVDLTVKLVEDKAFESEIISLSSNKAVRTNSSDSESSSDETESGIPTPKLEPKPESRWPVLDLSSVPHVKRRLDIKIISPTPPDSTCDETAGHKVKQEWDRDDMEISHREPQTKWPDTDLSAVSPGPIPAESSSSSSESEDERRYTAPKPEREVGAIEREAVPHPKETLVEVSLTPKRALDITLKNSANITDEAEDRTTADISPAQRVTPELESMLAGMALGISRLRKHTGSASPKDASPKVPSTPLPESSSSSSESADEHQDRRVKQTNTGTENVGYVPAALPRLKRRIDIKSPEMPPPAPPSQRPQVSSSSSEREDEMGKEQRETTELHFKSQSSKVEKESNQTESGLNSVLHIKRRLDIKAASPLHSESSSSSEDETSNQKKEHDGDRLDLGSKGPETKWPNLDFSTIPVLKRRLDIKAPFPDDSFSFSSKEEGADQTIKQGERDAGNLTSEPGINVSLAQPKAPLVEVSLTNKRALNITLKNSADITDEAEDRTTAYISPAQRVTPELESRWAGMTLQSESSSSSEDESSNQKKEHDGDRLDLGSKGPKPETKWPKLDFSTIPVLKRRLDIKLKESNITLKNSADIRDEAEDRTTADISPVQRVTPELESRWTGMTLQSESSSSSEDESSNQKKEHDGDRLDLGSKGPKPETKWPKLDFSTIPVLKRRLDIKLKESNITLKNSANITDEAEDRTTADISPAQRVTPELESRWAGMTLQSESSSSSEDESSNQKKEHDGDRLDLGSKGPKPETKWPNLDFSTIPVLKRRLDIKLKESNITLKNSATITDEAEDRTTADISPAQRVTPELESMWAGMALGISRLRKHKGSASPKDASPKVPSAPLPESSSSSSESEDVHQDCRVKQTNTGTEYNSSRTEVKKDPGYVLAALGVPRIKRRMDIKSPEKPPPPPPSPRSHVSSDSSESEDGTAKGQREMPELYPKTAIKVHFDQSVSSNLGHGETTELHFNSQSSQVGRETKLGLSSDFHIIRRQDIKAVSTPQSESSGSEDEASSQTKKHDGDELDYGSKGPKPEKNWPLLDLNRIPGMKRSLDIKATSPPLGESSSFSSKEESADYAIILGEREAGNTEKDSHLNVGGLNVSLAQGKARNISFDEIVRKRIEQTRPDPRADLHPESRWTGFVHQSKGAISVSEERHAGSDLPASNSRRPVNVQPQQEAPPAVPGSRPPLTSSSSSDSEDDKKQEREKHKFPPPNPYSSVSPMSTSLQPGALNLDIKFDNTSSSTDGIDGSVWSEDRREIKGLTALRTLSSSRENWDTAHEELERSSSQHTEQYTSYHGHPTFKYQATRGMPFFSSTSTDGTWNDGSAAGMGHDISQHSSHTVVDTQPPQEAPPPVPGSPPPEEDGVAVPMWRSLKSTSFTSRSSDVERSPSLIGLGVATPYHTTRGYRSITSTTTQLVRTDQHESNVTNTSSKTSTLHFDDANITEV